MSAALQLPSLWAAGTITRRWRTGRSVDPFSGSIVETDPAGQDTASAPFISLAFYRKHTEKMLRRYLYASMLVGRAPAILGEPIGRGWVSSRKVKTFEDAVIFVLDIEKILKKLGQVDQAILSRMVLQEYTQEETAAMLGVSVRAISYKYKKALDSLTEMLLHAGLLILPPS
ncbi:MAG: sigma factor-like helix-turn-helix DNA-binding protein [Terracidiphilus sp.]